MMAMSKTNFFQQAPAQDTYQKRFLEAVLNNKPLIASFPLGYPLVSIYALSALMSDGLAVVICANSGQIRRNLEYFRQAGLKFPDVAYLDGTQMPHEERSIYSEINHHRIRVLYITPERFTSLTFLEIMVHQKITFLAIDEAERLLPEIPGHASYQRLIDHGLKQLSNLPPLVLMVPMMTPSQIRELSLSLGFQDYQLLQCPPIIEPIEIKVKRLFTEHQKMSSLINFLSGSSESDQERLPGRLDNPGAVWIQTAFPAQAEKIGSALQDYGFESVYVTHFKKSAREQVKVLDIASVRSNAIVVNAGGELRAWTPPMGASPKLVFWNPPANLDEMVMQVFRQPSDKAFLEASPIKVRIYYTREDFQSALLQLKPRHTSELAEPSEKLWALRCYREWVLSETCRLQSLDAHLQGSKTSELAPCGRCDRCTEVQDLRWKLQRFLQNWLY